MSNCSCIHVCDDYDHPEAFEATQRKARKSHKCGECGREITKGEDYEYVFGIWDGEPGQHKTCTDCLSVRDEFFCDGYIFGQIWEDVHEHIWDIRGRISSDCLANITPVARERICEIIEEIWEDEEEDEPA